LFLYFPFLFDFILFIYFQKLSKGVLDPEEQKILGDWYSSLTSKGSLNWNTANDLCKQNGVTCDSSNPQRVIELYPFGLIFSY